MTLALTALLVACGGVVDHPAPAPVATASAAARPTFTPAVVTIGQVGGISDAAIYIADAKGYFKEQGITLQSSSFPSAANMVAPLLRGDLMVGGGASGAGIFNAIRTGTAMRIVADKGTLVPGHGYEGLVVRSDLADQIKSAKDLKGRTIALAARDITPEVTLNTYLVTGGLTIKDVNVVVVPHAQMLAGFTGNGIDAGLPIEPFLTGILDSGKAKLLTRDDMVTPNFQTAVVFYSEQFAKQHDLALRFMTAYLQGARFFTDAFDKKDAVKRVEAIAILAKATGFDSAQLEKVTMPGIDPNGRMNVDALIATQDYMVAKGSQAAPIDIRAVVDLSFADEAVKALGPYSR
ncbi:MAG TPA: ABC transporter substrate-binding protein [Candidatus Limnocylindria bacterium]|nr:ABC transporter substrate-binding protein [Candidatus Limnocylindria bacterium]